MLLDWIRRQRPSAVPLSRKGFRLWAMSVRAPCAVLAFVILAILAPPAFAQAPAPKVTITGLFDQITSAGWNFYDGNLTRTSDREWTAHVRFRPDFEFAVGRVKAAFRATTRGPTRAAAMGQTPTAVSISTPTSAA
jgi:hypothetical protein